MADGYISAVQLPGDNTYDIKDKNAITEIQINGTAQTKTDGVVNLPDYPTDTKVTQGNTTTDKVRPLILEYNSYSLTTGADNNIETGYNSSNVTNQVYRTNNIYACPANGRLYLSSTATPQMYLKYRTLDYTLADNGMSSEQWVGYRIVDKNNKVVALFNLDVFPDGKIGAFVRAGNYNSTTSSGVSGYMGVFAHKDGSVSYSISHKDKFREAIEVYSKLETETPIRSYLTSTVGHACKNLLDITSQTHNSQVVIESIDDKTGSIHISTTGGTNHVGAAWNFSFENGHSYVVSFINLLENAHASVTIRRSDTYVIKYSSGALSTLGNKTFTFTFTDEEFPEGAYVSLRCTDGTGVAGAASISEFMLRESTILDDTFEPYEEPTDLRSIKVKQSLNTQKKFYPLLFSSAEYSNSTSDIIDTVSRANNTFIYPYSGWVYAGGGFCAGTSTSPTEGKRCYINVNGITANNYKADYSIAAYERQIIQAYPGKCSDNAGLLLKIDSGGLTIIGGGESGQNLAGLIDDDQTTESPARLDIDNSQGDTTKETTALLGNSEHLILASDGNIYFVTKCNSTNAPNRIGVCLSNERVFYPMRDNTGSIGSNSYRWANGYFKLLNNINTVNYQKATDSGDTKYPAKWYCSMGKTPADGDIVTITVPAEGGNGNGVYLSIEGNTNAKYKPISVSKATKLTTHFGAGEIITLVYRAAGSTDAIYPINGGTATTTVSGGCWSVLNYYNTNTDTKVTQTNTTGDASYRILFSNTADNTSRTEAARKSAYLLFNPNTKTLTTTNLSVTKINGVTVGSTPVFTDRYVNSASFAHDSTNNNVKMTLTRAGSDTSTVTANIPLVSSSTAGVAPKGATVSSQSQSTKFLREDGSWATPSYTTNTDTKVTQINTTNTTEDDSYRILFSNTADNTNRTEAARKSAYLLFNPSTKTLTTTNLSVTDNLYIGRSGSTTGKIYFFSTSNNTSMYGRIEQTFNSTQSNLVHKLPSTSGTLLNDSIFKTIYNDEGTSSQFPSDDISYNITDFKEKIKFMDIHYTDSNYLKNTSTGQQKSENFGYLRIPFDLIKDGGFASTTPTIRFSLSLIGDQNSYYLRKQTYGFYVLQSGSAQSGNQTYTLYIQKLAQGLTMQFYGAPGTAPNWGNMTVRAHLKDDVIRILRITLILEP